MFQKELYFKAFNIHCYQFKKKTLTNTTQNIVFSKKYYFQFLEFSQIALF